MESATIDTEIEDRSRVSPPSYCDHPEEVGQAGRKASWVPVPNCARDFFDSLAVVE